MSETLTLLQIQLLLYYLGAEPSKRTVTDSAKNLGITKWAVTRAMDAMEKQDIVERLENRKTVLTMTGKKLAEKYQNQMKVLEQYSYFFPFIIYREHIKNYNNVSMGNKGFEHPCELIVKDHEGMICLTAKTVSAESMSGGRKMDGRIQKMQYLYDGKYRDSGMDGRYVYFPVTALNFISMGKGRDTLLHGSVCLKMQCSVGDMHMPESTAVFTMFIH